LIVIITLKYGGNAIDLAFESDPLLGEIAARVAAGDRFVLVHGGGPQVDAALAEAGVAATRVRGLRVTDARTLTVAEAVLCGTVNKALVRALRMRGVNAAGLSGQDGGILVARRSPSIDGVSLGFVGEVSSVDPRLLHVLIDAGFVPVISPIALDEDGSSALNVNADIAAGAIAGAISADAYVVVTNVSRVRRIAGDPTTDISMLTVSEARSYLDDGTFDGGMRPKIEGALDALARGARSAMIIGQGAGALARALAGDGTTIVDG
jgi:acetylglutamate kinase